MPAVNDRPPPSRDSPSSAGPGGGHPARVGHYRVLELLSAGVLTNVYRAESEGIGRVVALKVLRSSAGAESASFRRFEREGRLLASLHHPNLIELYDFDRGVPGDRPPYMVLEHISGATLSELLQRSKRLEPDEASAIALEVARALAYAHAQRVVHRDVKPGNILIGRTASRDEGDSAQPRAVVVKLVDFGIAQDTPELLHSAEGLADASDAVGTPAYMSPEQLLGERVDHRSDQFALGIVLYQMLTGVRPFDGDDGRPAIQRVRRDPPRPFRTLGVAIPKVLERLVLRCLAKRPSDRFEATEEIVDELTRYFEGRVELSDLAALHRRVLARAGVVDERKSLREEVAPTSRPVRSSMLRVRSVPLAPTVIGVALACIALSAGGAAIQLRSGGIKSDRDSPVNGRPLESDLAAGDVGKLRVLVRPWADVIVDGERVDTTPMSRPIRLQAGRHVVMLVHPLISERRIVEIRAGETTTLEAVLTVPSPSFADEFAMPETSASAQPAPSMSAGGAPFGVSSTLSPQPEPK